VTLAGKARFSVVDKIEYSMPVASTTTDNLVARDTIATEMISNLNKIDNNQTLSKSKRSKISNLLSSKIQRISALVMILTAILVAFSVSLIDGATKVDPLQYQESSSNTVALAFPTKNTTQRLYDLRQNPLIEYIVPYTVPMQLRYANHGLFQSTFIDNEYLNFTVKPLPLELIKENDILYGEFPSNSFEAVIDKFFIESAFFESNSSSGMSSIFGITSPKGFLGGDLYLSDTFSIRIVGISNTNTPTIYLGEDLLFALSTQSNTQADKPLLSEKLTPFVTNEIHFDNNDEIYISESAYNNSGFIASEDNHIIIADKEYYVKGYYQSDIEIDAYILSSTELEQITFAKLSASAYLEVVVKGNVDEAVDLLMSQGISARPLTQIEYDAYLRSNNTQMTLQLVFTIAIGVAAILFCYFSAKTTIIEKKKELAVKVALGEARIKLLNGFIVNALIFFGLFALPSYIVTGIVIESVLIKSQGIFSMMSFSIANFAWGCLILLSIPIAVTILPMTRYLFKKPILLLRE
jgi:hypothetical protein